MLRPSEKEERYQRIKSARAAGKAWAAIAEEMGLSKQGVYQFWSRVAKERGEFNIGEGAHFRAFTAKNCVYPVIRKWLNFHEIRNKRFAEMMGLSPSKTRSILSGRIGFKNADIAKLCNITKLSYEDLFYGVTMRRGVR